MTDRVRAERVTVLTRARRRWLAGLGALILLAGGAQGARADALTGRWIASGNLPNGSPFVYQYAFGPDGSFQSELDVGDDPYRQVSSAGRNQCVGVYQFDGTTVTTRLSACQNCNASGCAPSGPVPFPQGAVTFPQPNVMVIGDFVLRRE